MRKQTLAGYKKDTVGLFDGGYKSQVFDTKEDKADRRKKPTRQYLDEMNDHEG